MDAERALDVLNELIETCRDGEQGFRTAAEAVTEPHLQGLFRAYAEQRAEFVAELSAEVRRLGGDPDRRGSVAGSLHRGWMNIRSVVSGGNQAAIVAEAERGEDSARAAYERALRESTLPPGIAGIVERQAARVREAHDRVRALRERAA